MGRIGRKLKSEQGASMVLVLLFMLACMMAGASVLMAASSNGGRIRSGRQEQQAYFALSCALRMVADDLAGAEYCGSFAYTMTQTKDPEGNVTETRYTYEQRDGEYDCLLGKMFLGSLDALFADNMKKYVDGRIAEGESSVIYECTALPGAVNTARTLTVTLDQEQLKDFQVQIEAKLYDAYNMELTASLAGFPQEYGTEAKSRYADYVLKAELTPMESIPRIDESKIGPEVTAGVFSSTPMSWELKWIVRPEEEGG